MLETVALETRRGKGRQGDGEEWTLSLTCPQQRRLPSRSSPTKDLLLANAAHEPFNGW